MKPEGLEWVYVQYNPQIKGAIKKHLNTSYRMMKAGIVQKKKHYNTSLIEN
jgi:hypothetical protein